MTAASGVTDRRLDLLVAGAGPTGLTLALQAVDHGARVRIVERHAQPVRPSRTLLMHPRSLELLRPLGVTDALISRGDTSMVVRLHRGSRVAEVALGRLELAGTAFPFLLLLRQADVEEVLEAALAARGVPVERGVEVARVARVGNGGALAVVRGEGRPDEVVRCRYLVGCDGPASLVRRSVGSWLGDDYDQEVVLADVELGGAAAAAGPGSGRAVGPEQLQPGAVHIGIGRGGLAAMVHLGERAGWRMLSTRPAGADGHPLGSPGPSVPREDLQLLLDGAGLPAPIAGVAWSAAVPAQHYLASRFSRGPLFVAGEAAHVHASAGAQGVNAGIHDAVNLGWKLAFAAAAGRAAAGAGAGAGAGDAIALGTPTGALAARPGSALLASYAEERRPADRSVLRLTHLLFQAASSRHPLAQAGRLVLAPLAMPLLPWLARRPRIVAASVRRVAQFRLRYPHSPLSMEVQTSLLPVRGGLARRGLRPGSRVADALVRCAGQRVRLHELLAGPGVHILLQADARAVPERMLGPLVHAYRLDDRPGTGMLVVRPDGYVALRAPVLDEVHLAAWLRLVGLTVR